MPIDALVRAVNLIPSEHRASSKAPAAGTAAPTAAEDSPFGAYVILGALLFAVAAAALYVLTTNSIAKNKADLSRVNQQVEQIQAQATSLQSFADFKTLADSRRATVRGLAGSRFAWARTLDDVSRALPPDVYVSALDGATSGAGSGISSAGSIVAPSIKLSGCTRNQSSVVRLMSTLRSVRGATRVSLEKSTAPEDAGLPTAVVPPAPPAQGSGPKQLTTSLPCPKGAPPDFEVTMYFERSAAGANASSNAPAGPGGVIAGPTGPAGATSGPTGASGAATPAASTPTTTP